MCITASAVLMEQRIQLQEEAKDKNKNFQKKINAMIKNIQAATKANTKRLKLEKLKVAELNNFLMHALPDSKFSDKSYIYTNKPAIIKIPEAI